MEDRPSHIKRKRGVYYTASNPFTLEPFREWCKEAGTAKARILEPFAGSNNIIRMLSELGLCTRYRSYDIAPKAHGIKKRDTIKSFPSGYKVCVTNPPWLTSYSARRRGVEFVAPRYDNLYKYCLELALANCEYVAFIYRERSSGPGCSGSASNRSSFCTARSSSKPTIPFASPCSGGPKKTQKSTTTTGI